MEALRGTGGFDLEDRCRTTFFRISKPLTGQREKEFVLDALDSGWYPSIGKYVEVFGTNFVATAEPNMP